MRRLLCMIGSIFLISLISVLALPSQTVHAANTYQDCLGRQEDSKDPSKNEAWVIRLNTNVPFVWRCIHKRTDWEQSNATNALPKLLQALVRIAMTVVVVAWFLWILVWGFMITGAWAFWTAEKGKRIIIAVIVGLILLWASWIILSLVNPDFFTTT